MATTVTKTDDMVRFVQGTEAAYMASTSTFKNDVYVCTDTGALYVRGQNMNTRRHYRQYPVQNGKEMLFNTGLKSTRSDFFIWRFILDGHYASAPTDILIRGYLYQPTSGPVFSGLFATGYGAQVFETIKAYMYNGYVWFWFPAGAAADFKTYTAELIDHHANGTFDMGQAAWSTGSVPDDATGTVTMTVKYMALQSDLTALQSTVSNQNVSGVSFDGSTRALTLTKGDGSTVNDTLPVASESTASGYGLLGAQAWGDLSSQVTTLQGKVAGSTTVTQGTESVEVALNDTNGNELTSATVEAASSTQAGVMTSAQVNTLTSHVADTNNPHGVTKAQVGLGNVDNTADKDKKVKANNIKWGGNEISGDVSPIDSGVYPLAGCNRLAFINQNGVTIEYSNDAGATWMEYDLNDSTKIQLFNDERSMLSNSVAPRTGAKNANGTLDDYLRVTIDAIDGYVYTLAKNAILLIAKDCATAVVDFETSFYKSPDTFTLIGTYNLSGNSAYNSIPINSVFGGAFDYQIRRYRFTFRATKLYDTTISANASKGNLIRLYRIALIGTNCWYTNSTMATTGHLYDYDYQQNAKFPAKIYTNKNVQVIDTAGTGLTKSGSTLSVAPKTVLDSFGTATDSPTDNTYYMATGSSASDGNYYRRKMSTLYSYMEGKLPDASSTARGLMTAAQVAALSGAASSIEAAQSDGALTVQLKGTDLIGTATTLPAATTSANGVMTAAQVQTLQSHTTSIGTLQTAVDVVLDFGSSATPSDTSATYMAMMTAATDGRGVRVKMSYSGMSITMQATCLTYNGTDTVAGYFYMGLTGTMRKLQLVNSSGTVTATWEDVLNG